METTHIEQSPRLLLQQFGFRATNGRIELLNLLRTNAFPLTIQDIRSRWKNKQLDQATLYRTLTDLTSAGIVTRIDLNSGTAHFEYAIGRSHHHHIICTQCGKIEDVDACITADLNKTITRHATNFNIIHTHHLEFFGTCTTCAKKP